MIPPLTQLEIEQYHTTKKFILEHAKNEAYAVRKAYIDVESTKLAKDSSISMVDARRIVETRANGILIAEDYLHFDNGSTVSVQDVLAAPAVYDRQTLQDPQEPEAGRCKAQFFANADSGKPIVFSQLHGGLTYKLQVGAKYDFTGSHGGEREADSRNEWPEPQPLITRQGGEPYPVDELPGIIGEAVREVVDFVQCPFALAANSALAVVSTVAQGHADVRRAERLEGPIGAFLLAFADSGERKTSVDNYFSDPIRRWEAEKAEFAQPAIKQYDADHAAWNSERSGILAAIKDASKGGKPTAELKSKLTGLELNEPLKPKVPRLLFTDSTPEALAYRLANAWPVGGLLCSEGGAVLGGHAMKAESVMSNMALLNSLWDAVPFQVDRKAAGSFTLRGARLSIGLAVQPDTIRAFLDGAGALARGIGFLARFLVAWPESTQGLRLFKEPPASWPCLSAFHARVDDLLQMELPFNDRGELEPPTLELSPGAKAKWIAFHDAIEEELRPGRDMAETRDVASKTADNAARLAALFHLFEHGPEGAISEDHMQQAARLAVWHLYEARRFLGEIAVPVDVENATKLENWLVVRCRERGVLEIDRAEILQLGPGCVRRKNALDAALSELVGACRARELVNGRRKLVQVNPALLEVNP